MSDALTARIAEALFLRNTQDLQRLGFKSLVRENPDEHDMKLWRGMARAVVSELDLTDENVHPDRVVMSFWRFDEALRQAREEAWGEGAIASAKYEAQMASEYPVVPRPPDNPYRL